MKKLSGIFSIVLIAVMLLTFSSCSKYQKLLKSNDHAAKYEAALKYYEKKELDIKILENIQNIIAVTKLVL